MKKLELILWDYDGVIVDSFKDVHVAYVRICSELAGKYFENLEEFKKEYNSHNNHIEFLESLGIGRDKAARADEIFKEELAKVKPTFFGGIGGVLRKIYADHTMTIVSSAHRSEIITRLADANMLHLFMDISACEANGKYFHKAEPIRQAILKHSTSANNVAMIGDRNVDFLHAREAGIPAENIILVDYGWGYDRAKMNSESYCLSTKVDSPIKLPGAVREIELKRYGIN